MKLDTSLFPCRCTALLPLDDGRGSLAPQPHTPCMCSFSAGAGRCSPPRTPCIGSVCAGADTCPPLHTPCIGSFRADEGTSSAACLPPRRPPPCPSPDFFCSGSPVPAWGHLCLPLPPPLLRCAASLSPRCPPQARRALVARPLLHRSFCRLSSLCRLCWCCWMPPSSAATTRRCRAYMAVLLPHKNFLRFSRGEPGLALGSVLGKQSKTVLASRRNVRNGSLRLQGAGTAHWQYVSPSPENPGSPPALRRELQTLLCVEPAEQSRSRPTPHCPSSIPLGCASAPTPIFL